MINVTVPFHGITFNIVVRDERLLLRPEGAAIRDAMAGEFGDAVRARVAVEA